MEEGILSLRWNNHPSAFIHSLGTLLQKESYSDVTLACDGHFFPVHKLVLSVCSEYFEAIFNKTTCTKPVIVLKDIRHSDMLALLHYMYVGEANVPQSDLSRLIKAAECLRIKGLAVPDESPIPREKRPATAAEPSGCTSEQSAPKKRKPDLLNSVHNEGLEELSDGEEITEIRRAVVQHTSQPSRQMNEEVPQHLAMPVSASVASQVTILHPHQTVTHQIHFPQQQSSHNEQHRQMTDEDQRSTQDGVLVSHTIPEVLVEECPSVKEEAKDPIKEESSGRSNSLTALDGGTSDGEEDDDEEASEHTSTSGAGLMHDLLAIPGGVGQQQETLVSWDGSSGSLTSYTLEGLIPDELRQQAGGAVMRQHVCVYCGKRSFRDTTDLRRHIRTHTGERPYPCELCPYSATQLWHLRRHIARIHGQQAEDQAGADAATAAEEPTHSLHDSSATLDNTNPQVIIIEQGSSPKATFPSQLNPAANPVVGELPAPPQLVQDAGTKSYPSLSTDDLSNTQNSLLFLSEAPTDACSSADGRAGVSYSSPALGGCGLQQEQPLTPGP